MEVKLRCTVRVIGTGTGTGDVVVDEARVGRGEARRGEATETLIVEGARARAKGTRPTRVAQPTSPRTEVRGPVTFTTLLPLFPTG